MSTTEGEDTAALELQSQPVATTSEEAAPVPPPSAGSPATEHAVQAPPAPSAQRSGTITPAHVITQPVALAPAPAPPARRTAPLFRPLAPAPPRKPEERKKTSFYDLPPELRVEVYKMVLADVRIQVLPDNAGDRSCPHALVRTSHMVRNEVLPIIHSNCPIRVNITDFKFGGLLQWMQRIPATEQHYLVKNPDLNINLATTGNGKEIGGQDFRRWLHMRADPHRPQPKWTYTGPTPKRPVANELRRRWKRMTEEGKKAELKAMLDAIRVPVERA